MITKVFEKIKTPIMVICTLFTLIAAYAYVVYDKEIYSYGTLLLLVALDSLKDGMELLKNYIDEEKPQCQS